MKVIKSMLNGDSCSVLKYLNEEEAPDMKEVLHPIKIGIVRTNSVKPDKSNKELGAAS